jgi:hypothetical protein
MSRLIALILDAHLQSEPALYQRIREENRRAEVASLDRWKVRKRKVLKLVDMKHIIR